MAAGGGLWGGPAHGELAVLGRASGPLVPVPLVPCVAASPRFSDVTVSVHV